MEWLTKKWSIEHEEGEEEFIKKLFDTEYVYCKDEDVSTFAIQRIAKNLYTVNLICIEKSSNKVNYDQFVSRTYKPSKIEKVDGKIVTFDEVDLHKTVSLTCDPYDYDKKSKSDLVELSTTFSCKDVLFFQFRSMGSRLKNSGMYIIIQTITNKFFVRIHDHPKKLEVEDETIDRVIKRFTIKRTYSPPDINGRELLNIELACDGCKAYINATHNSDNN